MNLLIHFLGQGGLRSILYCPGYGRIKGFGHLLFTVLCFSFCIGTAYSSTPISLYKTFNGKYDYKVIGNTESTSELCPGEVNNTSANLNLPAGATVAEAYLYWSGSGSTDNAVTLNGQTVNATRTFGQNLVDWYWNMHFYGAFAKVTSLVNGNGSYSVNNLSWNKGGQYCQGYSAYGGWVLVVVYEKSSLPNCQLNIYDGFKGHWPAGTMTHNLGQVNIPGTCNPNVELTHVTWEGDNYKGEDLYIDNNYIGNNTLNGSTSPNLDIDTYNITNYVSSNQSSIKFSTTSYLTNNAIEFYINNVFIVKSCNSDDDEDGICNNQDCAPSDPSLPATPGTACNDDDPNTVNDIIQNDGCTCAGTFDPCATNGGDSDGDGVCNNQDCAPFDSNFPKAPGTACNDGNPNTVNDIIQNDGCTCAGTFDPCATSGGDSDGDGVCNNQDCAPFDPNFPKTPGTACNDGNPNTVNDVIQADGCTCAGTFDPCAANGGDSDGDGVCNNQDCAPFDSSLPTTPGTTCNDGDPNTVNDVIQSDGCTCAGSPPVCDNVTLGGTIGFGNTCDASATVCNQDVPTIINCASPSGGSGSIETIWLRAINNPNCFPPTTTIDDIANDPLWSVIPGETSLTLSPGSISQKTCYLRCTRRTGCDTYIESNIIMADIDPNCGGGGDPDCDTDISISTGNGTIIVAGLDGAPVSSLQIFTSDFTQQLANCFADCSATETVSVPNGDYLVFAKYYDAGFQQICEKQATVTVGGGGGGPCDNQGGDSDDDGVCDNQDCQPNNAVFPATPGSSCNDGNPNTTNDVVTADGCGCAGTPTSGNPDCDTDISVTTGNGTIIVSGLDGAPASSLQVFSSDWTQQFANCFADCSPTETISVPDGDYLVFAKYYTAGFQQICEKQATVTVGGGGDPCDNQGGDSDGDGTCDNQDCQPNNAAFPATPGTSCNDGNPNTTNDVITADGCGCAGTPIGDPCDNQGGDSDGDGTCDNQDCQPFNSAFPATPGSSCDDGNPNTNNDVVTSDGCGCAGTPTGGNPDCDADISITTGNGTIIVSGLDGAPISSVQVFNSSWGNEYSCTADCNATETINVVDGTYFVSAKYYTAGWSPICEKFEEVTVGGGGGPCDNQGGDSDGDGVCDNQDCQPNNASFPAIPGTSCNDGNPNTTNDVVTSDGCGCAGTPIGGGGCTPTELVRYDLNACVSCNNGTNADWSELTAATISNGGCAGGVSATSISPVDNGDNHSCTPGASGNSMCIDQGTELEFSVTLSGNGANRLTGISFYEKAPTTFVWATTGCSTVSGDNNPPQKFDVKVYKGGSLVFSTTMNTQTSWNQRNIDFTNDGDFDVSGSATFTFVFTPYGANGSGSVKTWDLDEVQVFGCCGGNTDPCTGQGGDSDGDGVCNNQDCQPNNASFPATPGSSCNDGNPNTTNDVVTSDGCGCAGTPVGGGPDCDADISITSGNGTITVAGLDGSPVSSLQVFNSSWGGVFSCAGNCNATETINVGNGTYFVSAKYFTAGWSPICEKFEEVTVGGGGGPCDNQGGDSDGDGVCDNQDCQPNNSAFPATPGSACNDGDPNTENDVVTSNGCGCAGTPVNTGCTATELVRYDLDACVSCTNGTNADWSELTAATISNGGCGGVTATSISPVNNNGNHSCTPGASGNSMCIDQGTELEFSVTLDGNGANRLTGISFYEKAPTTFVWETAGCSTVSGDNNPPQKFDVKVYKGGSLVFSTTMNTQTSWNQRSIDFTTDGDFDVNGSATFTFVFSPYGANGSGSIKTWDLDEVKIFGCCDGNTGGGGDCASINITGGSGKITVTGLDGSAVSSLQIFNASWGPEYSCFDNCNATEDVALSAGTYYVFAKLYDGGYNLICEKRCNRFGRTGTGCQ